MRKHSQPTHELRSTVIWATRRLGERRLGDKSKSLHLRQLAADGCVCAVACRRLEIRGRCRRCLDIQLRLYRRRRCPNSHVGELQH